MTSLQGSLEDFGVPEIIQLISLSRKSGTLKLISNAEGLTYFESGRVFFATTTIKRKPLGQRLLEKGVITKTNLDKVLQIQKEEESKRRLGQILIDSGFLSPTTLDTFVQEQIWNDLWEMLSWSEGHFNFSPDETPTQEDISISIGAWERVKESMPSFRKTFEREHQKKIAVFITPDMIFKQLTLPETPATEALLNPPEKRLIRLIDGKLTVRELTGMINLAEAEIHRLLNRLSHFGLIEMIRGHIEETAKTTQAKSPQQKEQPASPSEGEAEEVFDISELQTRLMGPIKLWTTEGEKEVTSFVVKKGEKNIPVLLFPNGTFQFQGKLSKPEKEEVVKQIQKIIREK